MLISFLLVSRLQEEEKSLYRDEEKSRKMRMTENHEIVVGK